MRLSNVSVRRRATVCLLTFVTAATAITACDASRTMRSPENRFRLIREDTTPVPDTVPCTVMDTFKANHCPTLLAPQGTQAQAIEDGILDTTCPWMGTYLLNMWIHGNINMYGGFTWDDQTAVGQMGDNHLAGPDDLMDRYDRMHINGQTTNYKYIHWVIRHEAAHSYNPSLTEDQADSVANSCGADQKPYQ